MRLRSLGPRDRRALVAGVLLAAVFAGWRFVGAPLAHADAERRARLASSRDLLARELEVLASADSYPPLVATASHALRDVMPRLLDGGTPGARSASLVAWVQSRARAAGVRVTEIAPVDDSASVPGLQPVSVRIAGRAVLGAVLAFVSSIEGGDKLVRVSSLGISGEQESETGVLHFDLTATGYVPGDLRAHGSADGTTGDIR